MQDLEGWAKSQARRFSAFGSSMHKAVKPEMETVQKIILDPKHGMPTDLASWQNSVFERNVDGNCKTCGKAESNHRGHDPKFCYDTHYRRMKKGESSGYALDDDTAGRGSGENGVIVVNSAHSCATSTAGSPSRTF